MWRAPALVIVVAATAVAFVIRVVLVAATRRRWPSFAANVERWWVWTPVAVVCGLAVWAVPLLGVAMTMGVVVLLTRADAIGSPFRPRR